MSRPLPGDGEGKRTLPASVGPNTKFSRIVETAAPEYDGAVSQTGSGIGRLRRLQEVIARATAAPSQREVARVIVEEGVAALGGWLGGLWLAEDDATLELIHWVGVEPGRRFRRVPLAGESPLALAVRTKTPVWISSRAEYVAAFPQSEQSVGDREPEGEIACACLPLVAGNGAIGGLMLAFHAEHPFPEDERTFLVTIASQCAHAIERLQLLDSLNQLLVAEAEARRQAEAASRAKDEFLALLGHELRNPLAPIRQAVTISRNPAATEAQKNWSHEVITRQVQHMSLLLDDLLDISRITRGTLELRRQHSQLANVIESAIETARPAIDAKRHTLGVHLPQVPVTLDVDPLRLSQVLSNLLTNAAKYTDPDGQLRIDAELLGGEVLIRVVDNGIGIAPEAMPDLFTMFSQVHAGKDRSDGGLGIGLALSRGLIELHGGRLDAHSQGLGCGSEFIVRLPAVAQASVSKPSADVPVEGATRRRRILVADDNIDAGESLAMLLRLDGHEVELASNGSQAVELFERMKPEVAILDIGMPGLNGYEVAQRIRKKAQKAVTLIAVTGWGQEADKARAAASGFDHHFTKPVEPAVLSALVGGE